MKFNRGDLVLVLFPDSNLQTFKRRPAVVVQAGGLTTGLPQMVLALISSNMARAGPAFRIHVPIGSPLSRGTGLRADSVIMLDNLATVLDSLVDRKIGAFSDMSILDKAICVVFNL